MPFRNVHSSGTFSHFVQLQPVIEQHTAEHHCEVQGKQ